jgi:hypothetical protein
MASRKRSWSPSEPPTIEDELDKQLAQRYLFKGSWTDWSENQRLANGKARKNRLLKHSWSLLSIMPQSFANRPGAYFDVTKFTEHILRSYHDLGIIQHPPNNAPLMIKFGFDGTEQKYTGRVTTGVTGRAVALSITIMDVAKAQSKNNAHTVGFYIGNEDRPDLERFFLTLGLDDFLGDWTSGRWKFVYRGKVVPVDFYLNADWAAFGKELGLDEARTKDLESAVCYACGVTKAELGCGKTSVGTWWQTPFKRHAMKNSLSVFTNPLLERVRRCILILAISEQK